MNEKELYKEVTVKLTPSAAMMIIHGVLNKAKYPNIYPIVELGEKIAVALGFENKKGRK